MIRRLLSLPIRVQMILLIFLIAVPFIPLVVLTGLTERDNAIQGARDECLRFVNSIAREQQSMAAGAHQLLTALALTPDVQKRNYSAIGPVLRNIQKDNPQYANIAVTDEAGVVRAATIPSDGVISVADRKYIRDAIRTGKFSSGEYIVGRLVRGATINFGYPVMDDSQRLIAVLFVAVDLDFSRRVFQSLNMPSGSSFSLLDHQGVILFRNIEDSLSGRLAGSRDLREEIFTKMTEGPDEGTFDATGNDGNFRLFAYRKISLSHEPGPYLYIRSSIPKASAVSQANAAMYRRLAVLLSLFAGGMFLFSLGGKRVIVTPIEQLKTASRQLASGAGAVNVSNVVQGGELGELARSFDSMAEALLQSRRRLSDIIEFLPDATLVIDKDGKVIAWNRAIEVMTGVRAEEMIGKGDHEYAVPFYGDRRPIVIDLALHPDPEREKLYTAVRRTGDRLFGESFVPNLPSGVAHLSATASVLRDGNGNVVAAIECIRDNTDRRRAEEALAESEEQFRAMFEVASIGMAQADPHTGRWLRVNRKMCVITGYTSEELLAMRVPEITHPEDRKQDWEMFQQVIRGERNEYRLEKRYIRKDGQVAWVNVNMTVVRDAESRPMRTMAAIEDISERRRAEEALRESEQKYRLVFDNAPLGLLHFDQNGVITACNDLFVRLVGSSREALIGLNMFNLPDTRIVTAVQDAISGQIGTYEGEYASVTAKKKTWVKCIFAPVRSDDGRFLGGTGIVEDIADRRQAEEDLKKNQARLADIIDFLPDATLAIDVEKRVIIWNRAIEKMTGIPAADMIGRGDYAYTIPFYGEARPQLMDLVFEDRKEIAARYPQVDREGDSIMAEAFCNALYGGKGAWVFAKASPLHDHTGNVTGAIEVIRDINDRKLAEEALRDSRRHLSDIIDFLPDAMLVIDREKKIVVWNRALEEMTGVPASQMLGKGEYAYTVPFYGEPRPQLMDLFWDPEHEIASKYPFISREGKNLVAEVFSPALHGGKGGHVWLKASPLLDAEGRIAGAIEVIRDTTEQRMLQAELARSERLYRNLVDSTPVGVFQSAVDGTILFVNDAFLEIAGYDSIDEIQSVNAVRLYRNPRDRAEYLGSLRKSGIVRNYEVDLLSRGKGVRNVLMNSVLEEDVITGTVIDITDRKRLDEERRVLEERLQRSEKMESLGMLAGGVAHDLNNALGILVGYSELLADEIERSSPLRPHVEYIRQGGERAAAIVQDLLTLARRGVQSKEIVDLAALVDEVRQSPEFEKIASFHRDVHVETALTSQLLNIKGSPIHLRKTILNLVANAAEAMPDGGSLTIGTDNRYLDRPLPGYDHIREGEYVVLTVADTGKGISEADMKRIFEPFYTKKVMGRSGTGLGLAVVWGTVKDHGGYINVQSEEGKGSVFSLYFPVSREEAVRKEDAVPAAAYRGRGESVLVVDDVQGQRELAVRILKKLNYRVIAVSSGESAVGYVRANRVDLVVLDMIMDPGMDGLDTFLAMRELHPDQKAIIVSGYSESERVQQAQAMGAGAYVRKPYMSETLGMAVRKALDAPA